MSTSTSLPGSKHKVIGLVSGGKDSCFNLMHCIANGHEIVAIATLVPEDGIDELDSHLYQSVGTHLLPLLARSMGLPHFSRVIRGKAVDQGAEYGSRIKGGVGSGKEGDETEDLLVLLQDILAAHPEATAIASGAILSTYQRLRIEHVASRLSLVSLAYLWQQPQLPLVDTMIDSGVEAILVKVAGVGLGVDVVGRSLGEVRPLLEKLERQYRSHPAGEGGEYETLTLSTPLFSHRLNLIESETVITDPEPYPVAYLRVKQAELVEKSGWTRPTILELREMLGLDVKKHEGLDEGSMDLLERLRKEVDLSEDTSNPEEAELQAEESGRPSQQVLNRLDRLACSKKGASLTQRGRWFTASVGGLTEGTESIGTELGRAFDAIVQTLTLHSLSLPLNAAHITLLLSDMSLFPEANKTYITYFGVSPPSRATIAVPLPVGQRMRLEIVGFDDRPFSKAVNPDSSHNQQAPPRTALEHERRLVGERTALHVQSLSYWAPANIGPYSQTIIVNSRLSMAGQIPLIPASLTLPPLSTSESPYFHQSALALQHVRRVLEVLRSKLNSGGGWSGWGESCTVWWAEAGIKSVPSAWNREGLKVIQKAWEIWSHENDFSDTPVTFVRASQLPKEALVEVQINLHTGRRCSVDNIVDSSSQQHNEEKKEDDDDDDELVGMFASGSSSSGQAVQEEGIRWETCMTSGKTEQGSRGVMFFDNRNLSHISSDTSEPEAFPVQLQNVLERAVGVKIYHLPGIAESTIQQICQRLWPIEQEKARSRPCLTAVPVLEISDRYLRRAAIAIEIFGI